VLTFFNSISIIHTVLLKLDRVSFVICEAQASLDHKTTKHWLRHGTQRLHLYYTHTYGRLLNILEVS